VLSRALIDEKLVGGDSGSICYFFFKDNAQQNSASKAICALLHQLFRLNEPLFFKHAVTAIKENGEGLKTEFEGLWRLLMATAADPEAGNIVCILDALDECDQNDKDNLIEKLEQFYTASAKHPRTESRLKFLVTSRPYQQIELRFFKLIKCVPTIRLAGEEESKTISQEINVVIKVMVEQIGEELGLNETIQLSLEKRLSGIPQRTYLWLRVIWDEVRNALGKTENKLLKMIEELPKTVEEAYEMLLRRCAKKEEAMKVLHIIVAAQRPLTLREMDVALEIRADSRSYEQLDLEGEQNRKTYIRNLCGLFVSIVDSKVYLIHQTAKEFLVRKNHEEFKIDTWRHSLTLRESHRILSEICITHLFFHEFRGNSLLSPDMALPEASFLSEEPTYKRRKFLFLWRQDKLMQDFGSKHALLDYSANHWATHFREASTDEAHCLTNLASKLCEINIEGYPKWFGINCASNPSSDYAIERQQFTEPWFTQKQSVKQPSALYWAAITGLKDVVQLLLKNGANVNAQGGHYDNALQAAAAGGYEKVVEQLLHVNAQGGHYGRGLHTAASRGYEKVVEQLLQATADINALGKCYSDALDGAAEGGQIKLLDRLVERVVDQLQKGGANVNAQGVGWAKALQTAVECGCGKQVFELWVLKVVPDGGTFMQLVEFLAKFERHSRTLARIYLGGRWYYITQ
jgi:Ankyrin repeats (3 copies)